MIAIPSIELSEQQILQGCITGNRNCQEMLYQYFAPRMFGICLRYASDYHQAEDLLQEGFVKVFNKLDRFRGDGSFEGWMKRIFINTAVEHYRKTTRQIALDPLETAPHPHFDCQALQNLAIQDLLRIIHQLPTGYRTIFNLYAIEGYTHKEIANMLNISEGTSKSQHARARSLLQKLIRKSL